MRNSRIRPDINAGSMADIAFLLLIFFLVCTTINVEEGIARDLTKPCADGAPCNVVIAQNNLLTIALGENNQLLVNEMFEEISNLKIILIEFIDNNASDSCDYCLGVGLPLASDHPQKAMISIETMRNASYDSYLAVQDEITAAYFELRMQFAAKHFDKPLNKLSPMELKRVKEAYPFQIMESIR